MTILFKMIVINGTEERMGAKKTLNKTPAVEDLSRFVNAFPEPMIALGADYTILAANPAYRLAFSIPGQDFVGRKCHEVSHNNPVPCDQVGETCPLAMVMETGSPQKAFHIHHSPNGRTFVDVEVMAVDTPGEGSATFFERFSPTSVAHPDPDVDGLIGESVPFTSMLALIHRVAPQEAAVLLLGETGTGKELVSHAIHALSKRSKKPFIAVDCSGLAENLIESELFGHEKGAFTGAHSRKIGLVETARGGTLFLDEIGDIPLPVQVKLLRLLETNLFRRVGGVDPLKADIRLISATHRNLKKMVHDGEFRQDLYYRINIFPIAIPTLRERNADIPVLVRAILGRITRKQTRVSPEAMRALVSYRYPGNIRELRNILERAVILSDGEEITPDHLPEITEPQTPDSDGNVFRDLLPIRAIEDRYLSWALERRKNDLPGLARELGISVRTLYRRIQALKTLSPNS